MARVRWVVFALLLAAVTVGTGMSAARAERPDPAPAARAAKATVTPVLSARRVPALLIGPVADRRLVAGLGALVATAPPNSCLVVSTAGRVVYSHNADVALHPASLEKLLTATAVLDILGPDATFTTKLVATAAPQGGVVNGDVWLVGGGDPVLETAAYAARYKHQPQTYTDVAALGAALKGAGIASIHGNLIGDDSRYDHQRYVSTWPSRYVAQDQTGPLSALSVNDGWAAFPPSPDVHTPDEDPAADPPQNAAAVVSTALDAAGVNVTGQPLSGKTPASANVVLAQISSPPLKDIVGEMLRESDAQASELLVKELGLAKGGAGATAAGLKAVTDDLAALGLPVASSVVKDGSGLDEGNLETCTTIQGVLEHAGRDSLIANALPIGGVSGTLDIRFLNSPATGRVHAKTGTLNAVTSLAGFVDSPNGPTLTFSLIINRAAPDRITSADVNLDDKIAELLTTYPQGPSLESVGPKPVP